MRVKGIAKRRWGDEQLFSLIDIAKKRDKLPIQRTHWALRRWATDGLLVGKQRIVLQTMRVAGRMHTSIEAIRDFLSRADGCEVVQ